MEKLMLSLKDSTYERLKLVANSRGCTIQELIRAVIVPEWMKTNHEGEDKKPKIERRKAPWER